jgi:hypothetical protein
MSVRQFGDCPRAEEVGSFKVPGSGERPSWSHPVILDGKLFLREQDHVLCYDIRAKGTGSPLAGR